MGEEHHVRKFDTKSHLAVSLLGCEHRWFLTLQLSRLSFLSAVAVVITSTCDSAIITVTTTANDQARCAN